VQAIRVDSNNAELRKNLGVAYFNIGSYLEAVKALKQALQLNPDDADTHYFLGLVYIELKDKELALQEHKALQELQHPDTARQLYDQIDRLHLR